MTSAPTLVPLSPDGINASPHAGTAALPATATALPSAPPRPDAAAFAAVLTGGAWMRLTPFGVIEVAGADAATFLHSQLTSDIAHLDTAHARPSGYCSAKGRLLASFLVWRNAEAVYLMLPQDVQAATSRRLAMFVLRAKARLTDANEAITLIGFAGAVQEALAGLFETLPQLPYEKVDGPAGTLIRLADAAGRPRYLWAAPTAEVEAHLARLGTLAVALPEVSAALWDWLEIQAGEPRITQPVVEQFVPQMVNFDVIGAVDFRKGCYPGQEVVARSQYRGTIKRRMALAHVEQDEAAASGVELFHPDDPGQPCGKVVSVAAAPQGGSDLLAELKLAALDSGTVHLGAVDGPALTVLPLPYSIPTEV
ncbi:YgfZ/GcvT domain-containing protein [Paraburkholderia hayleyella]|uniref:CAF17-like 4Fe-4S cluster assembly/insertion protein YgfZ n=1 Tax=Paraburkholderia hayleyella TaxID=2152889 RepID=UPI001290FC49|nr:folate-binding protein YgfZ [Paraburkholderia hayleyella]